MNEVGFKSISAAGFNQENITKQYNTQYNILPDTAFANANGYKMSNGDTKEIINLKKTVNRLEKNISFIQQEHMQLLKDLQQQIEKLKEQNQELQFQLVMRSSRSIDNEIFVQTNILNSEHQMGREVLSQSESQQIFQLKQDLKEEQAINSELIQKLNSITAEMEEVKNDLSERKNNSHDLPVSQLNKGEEINISPNMRITLDPLTMSLFHEGNGKYIINSSPSLEDCENIIKELLKKSQYQSEKKNSDSSIRSFSAQRTPLIPYIKRPLQNIKPLSQNSVSSKFNPLHGTLSSKPIGLTSTHQKLSPIVSHKNDITKLEKEVNRQEISRNSDRGNISAIAPDNKVGCSLPALPKPADYNQAEKQRRLHLLQRKRLDNYNNKL